MNDELHTWRMLHTWQVLMLRIFKETGDELKYECSRMEKNCELANMLVGKPGSDGLGATFWGELFVCYIGCHMSLMELRDCRKAIDEKLKGISQSVHELRIRRGEDEITP